jgi:hypothetical protein
MPALFSSGVRYVPCFHAGFDRINFNAKTLVILSGAKDLNPCVLPPLCRQDQPPVIPSKARDLLFLTILQSTGF